MAMLNNQRGYLPIFVAKIKVPNHPSHFDHGRKKSTWLVRGHIFPAKNLHISVGDFQLAIFQSFSQAIIPIPSGKRSHNWWERSTIFNG